MSSRWCAWPLAALLLLGGCALQRPAPVVEVDWQARDARLTSIESWQARGRIAVRAEAGGGQGDLLWRQHGDSARIRVSGPFGIRIVAQGPDLIAMPAAIGS